VFVPWKPRHSEKEARAAITASTSWAEVLEALGYGYFGKNIQTVRRWAARWDIPTDHLPKHQKARRHRHSAAEISAAVTASRSWAEALRQLGYCQSGGNWKTLKKRVAELGISTEHFDPYAASREALQTVPRPLEEILVRGSTYNRTALKRRLYESGLKTPQCEVCGQDEVWRGKRIALILDHANGVRDDNRLENLRIVCPNCAATLDTHCGRKNREPVVPLGCVRCGRSFVPRSREQRYCSPECGRRWDRKGMKRPRARRVERPAHQQLLREVEVLGYRAVGRKYGVSDNAIRKWLREFERERLLAEGRDPSVAKIPRRTWPNRSREEDDVAA
jgi:transposase-like protein